MRVLSLFSGVGGMDMGLERAGHEVVGMCEIDSKARSVLARHWPNVPVHDDVTTFETEEWRGRVDIVAGGSPCQDLSVAGKRAGLDGQRSGLFWHQCRIADQVAADWVLWENVAGALTSNNGADFAAVLWGITGALPVVPDGGWRSAGVCVGPKRTAVWRLLDAQWFGVAQRRRRVFVVGGPRGECGPEVLLESEGMFGNTAPSRESGKNTTNSVGNSTDGALWSSCSKEGTHDPDRDGQLIPDVYPTLTTDKAKHMDQNNQAVDRGQLLVTRVAYAEIGLSNYTEGVGTLRAAGGDLNGGSETLAVFSSAQFGAYNEGPATLCATDHKRAEANLVTPGVRRLTPRECERLMGWPDDWTRYDVDGNEVADSHRYRMCGNGVVSAVTEWIGRRMP